MAGQHVYLSTGCLHGEHEYCQAMTGQHGEKRPGRCKFCDAQCVCPCHRKGPMVVSPSADSALASLLMSMLRAGQQLQRPEPE